MENNIVESCEAFRFSFIIRYLLYRTNIDSIPLFVKNNTMWIKHRLNIRFLYSLNATDQSTDYLIK